MIDIDIGLPEIRISETSLIQAGASPELARAIANLAAISLKDSLRLARLQGSVETELDLLRVRVAELEERYGDGEAA